MAFQMQYSNFVSSNLSFVNYWEKKGKIKELALKIYPGFFISQLGVFT